MFLCRHRTALLRHVSQTSKMKLYLAGLATLAIMSCTAAIATPAQPGGQGQSEQSPTQRGCNRKEDLGVPGYTGNCKACDKGYHPEPDDKNCKGEYQCCHGWCCPGVAPSSSSSNTTLVPSLP
ncbi:hypothetical protein F5887DRAFT_978828 [Amanita rubescens]|nr:hypothetical protein F5887DRAFT_978828 [Amanita rubescens]